MLLLGELSLDTQAKELSKQKISHRDLGSRGRQEWGRWIGLWLGLWEERSTIWIVRI